MLVCVTVFAMVMHMSSLRLSVTVCLYELDVHEFDSVTMLPSRVVTLRLKATWLSAPLQIID